MATKKTKVNYTQKEFKGPESKLFDSRELADEWVKKNSDSLYWHQVVDAEPGSSKPRPIFTGTVTDDYERLTGNLSLYHETGMECLGLVFERDDEVRVPNPKFDPTKPEEGFNFRFFKSAESLIFIKDGHLLELPDGEIVKMIKDREFAISDGFNLSFYPQGFTKKELMDLFENEKQKVAIWVKKSSSLD